MNETFWIRTRRGVEGPVSRERVLQLVARNQLGSLDEISSDGRTWTRIRRTEFWGGTRAAPAPAAVPMPAATADDPVLQADPTARADKPNSMSRTSDSVSRIEISATSGRRTWKLPTLEEEQRGRKSDNPVSHAKRNAIVACAIGCVLLAVILGSVSGKKSVPKQDEPPSPTETSTPPAEPKPAQTESDVSEDKPAGKPSGSSSDSSYQGCEIGSIDPTDWDPDIRPVVSYLTPTYDELRQMLRIIRESNHISTNPLWANLTKQTRLYYYPEENEVNAFAIGYDKERDEACPTIIVQGGAGRFARLVGAVIATERLYPRKDIGRYGILFSKLSDFIEENGCISLGDTGRILDDCLVPRSVFKDESWLPEAKNISMGVLMGIMAHEIGHLAYGHVYSGSRTLERTRNQERDADSFACSVGSSEWFAESMFMGQLYFHFALALNESGKDSDTRTNHPFSRERLLNLIRSNRPLAAKCGFTEEGMREFLDDLHK